VSTLANSRVRCLKPSRRADLLPRDESVPGMGSSTQRGHEGQHGIVITRTLSAASRRGVATVQAWSLASAVFRGHRCNNRGHDGGVHGQRQGLRCQADRSSRRVRPELRAATATVGPDVASRDLLDHQQSVGYQLVRACLRLGSTFGTDPTAPALRGTRRQADVAVLRLGNEVRVARRGCLPSFRAGVTH
jgi:hypothetical protein